MSTVSVTMREKTAKRHELPVYLILAGLVASIALGVEVLTGNLHVGNFSVGDIRLVWSTLLALTAGVALDLTVGQRFTLECLTAAISNVQELGKFLAISCELGVLLLLIREFEIGNQSFYEEIALLTFLGFLIHYFLPLAYRLPFFLLLSLVGIQVVLGWTGAAWLVGIGLALIGVCHLPIRFGARVGLLLGTGALLALLRADKWLHSPTLTVIWPILGSMFMFRLIVYVYDLQHEKGPINIPATLSYFFLLPNVVFPLFPVVDYKMFRRTYYDGNAQEIYQRGIQWMFRGVFQLVLYRVVYNYFTLAPAEVHSAAQLSRYVVANFALYLRVSGLFHLIVGLLHLYGFHLPETHHKYFLSSSFNDFWRRINIYWKDFMMKLFFYPSYFRLKRFGSTPALVISTAIVFLASWMLHSYQWFWLRGTFPLTKMDAVFWCFLGLLVIINSLYETKHGRKRNLGKTGWKLSTWGPLALRTAGTFAVIVLIWSLWTATSLSEWAGMFHFLHKPGTLSALWVGFFFAGAALVSGAPGMLGKGKNQPGKGGAKPARSASAKLYGSIATTLASMILLLLAGNQVVYSHFSVRAQEVLRDIRIDGLNKHDSALLRRGYYENLISVERFNTQLWEVYMRRPTHWPDVKETPASRSTGDFLDYELRPLVSVMFKGRPLRTNRWGMRDQDYELHKPAHTYRYALLGASPEMGSGVGDNENFKWFLERQLNNPPAKPGPYAKYEILNFAVGGYSPLQDLWVLQRKVFQFQPDAVLYVAHPNDEDSAARHLVKRLRAGVAIPYPHLNDVLRQAGVDRGTSLEMANKRLQPYQAQMIAWTYQSVVAECQKRGAQPIFIFLGTPGENTSPDVIAMHLRLAQQAGFTTIDLRGWFDNQPLQRMIVAEWDRHPSMQGQKVIANKLYNALHENQRTALVLPAAVATARN